MINISIKSGDKALISRNLGLLADQVGDMSEIFEEVVPPKFYQLMEEQFATEGAAGGAPWPDYSGEPRYKAIKKAITGHTDLLRWQKGGKWEALYPSLTTPDSQFSYTKITPHSISIGTTVPHAADIERNTQGPSWSGSEPSPARYVMRAKPEWQKALITDLQRAIRKQLAKQGLEIKDARFNL